MSKYDIPKPIPGIKNNFKFFLGLSDVVILILSLSIALLPMSLGFKVGIKSGAGGIVWLIWTIIWTLLAFVLIIPVNDHEKVNNYLWYGLTYIFDIKKYGSKTKNKLTDLYPFSKIENSIMGDYTKSSVFLVYGNDISIAKDDVMYSSMNKFSHLLSGVSSKIQLIKINRRLDYQQWLEKMSVNLLLEIKEFLNNHGHAVNDEETEEFVLTISSSLTVTELLQKHKSKLKFLSEETFNSFLSKITVLEQNIQALKDLHENEFYEPQYFLLIMNKNIALLKEDCKRIKDELFKINHQFLHFDNKNLVSYASSYFTRNNLKITDTTIENPENIFPEEINFKPTYFIGKFKDNFTKYYRVIELTTLPTSVNDFWLSNLIHSTSENVFIRVESMSSDDAIRLLNRKEKVASDNMLASTRHLSESIKKNKQIESIHNLAEEVANGVVLKKFYVHIFLIEDSLTDLKRATTQFKQHMKRLIGYKWSYLPLLQKQGLKAVLPINDCKRLDKAYQNLPDYLLGYGYPFTNNRLQDEGAPLLGETNTGMPVMVDFTKIDATRTNSNVVVLGTSGSGKSFGTKKITKDAIASGMKIFAIDPENEYSLLARSMNGANLNLGANSTHKINPLQNYSLPDEGEEIDSMTQHCEFVKAFLSSAAKLNDDESSTLAEYIGILYKQFKISNSNYYSKKANEWPIIDDLYQLLNKDITDKLTDKKSSLLLSTLERESLTNLLTRIKLVLKDPLKNSLWNNHSTIKLADVSLTVFNISSIRNLNNQIVTSTQYLLLIYFIKSKIFENKQRYLIPLEKVKSEINQVKQESKFEKLNEEQIEEKLTLLYQKEKYLQNIWDNKWVGLVIDEAHLLIDEQNPTAIRFVYEIVKTIRKYHGMSIIITQNIRDFVASEKYKQETTAILNNAQYMFIFGLRGDDLNQLDELVKSTGGLTEGEKEFISEATRGKCLLMVGNNGRTQLQITTTDDERKIISSDK